MPIYIKNVWFPAKAFIGSPSPKKVEQQVNEVLEQLQSNNATVKDVRLTVIGNVTAYLIIYEASNPIN